MEPPVNSLKQWFSKWASSPPWGRFWGARRRTKQRGDRGQNNTMRVKTLNHYH